MKASPSLGGATWGNLVMFEERKKKDITSRARHTLPSFFALSKKQVLVYPFDILLAFNILLYCFVSTHMLQL